MRGELVSSEREKFSDYSLSSFGMTNYLSSLTTRFCRHRTDAGSGVNVANSLWTSIRGHFPRRSDEATFMKKWINAAILGAAMAIALPALAAHADDYDYPHHHHHHHKKMKDIRNDERDIARDQADISRDTAVRNEDVATGNYEGAHEMNKDIHHDLHDMNQDQRDLNEDVNH